MFTTTFTSKLAGSRFFFPLGNLLLYNSNHTIQYNTNTIQILLSTPHGGFSETSINSTGNQKKKRKKKVSQIDYQ